MEGNEVNFLADGARTAQGSNWFMELWHSVDPSIGFPVVSSVCLVLLMALLVKHKGAIATGLSYLGQSPRVGWKLFKGWWGARRMNKDQVAGQRLDIKSKIMDHIDTEVEEGRMTTTQANDHYRFFWNLFPDFKNCIEKVVGNAVIKNELAGSKDEHGKVIPVPLPGEVPATA